MDKKKKKITVKINLFNSDLASASARQKKSKVMSAEPSPVEVMTEGFMKLENGRLMLKYFEPAQFEMEKQMTAQQRARQITPTKNTRPHENP